MGRGKDLPPDSLPVFPFLPWYVCFCLLEWETEAFEKKGEKKGEDGPFGSFSREITTGLVVIS